MCSGGKRSAKGGRAFAAKQSRRWLDATRSAAALAAAGAACVTMLADREGDIYEVFALRPAEVELVIRAQQDRTLADGTLLSRCLDGVADPRIKSGEGRETVNLPAGLGNCYGPPPGPITIHRGLLQLRTMLHGWNLGQNVCIA